MLLQCENNIIDTEIEFMSVINSGTTGVAIDIDYDDTSYYHSQYPADRYIRLMYFKTCVDYCWLTDSQTLFLDTENGNIYWTKDTYPIKLSDYPLVYLKDKGDLEWKTSELLGSVQQECSKHGLHNFIACRSHKMNLLTA